MNWQVAIDALTFQAGYNTALVAVGAALLGLASGSTGTFVLLRKRSLVTDAISHATLPGICIAFMVMVSLGGDGRFLPGLSVGALLSSALGLLSVDFLSRRTRLSEDAAIGAVLSVFFGAGVVLLTIIQNMADGRQAGLATFLLGSTAGMLINEAVSVAIAGILAAGIVFLMRRSMTLVCFDAEYAGGQGINIGRTDLAMMAMVLMVTVIGLRIVGLVLVVALLIIPPVAARIWTDRVHLLIPIAAFIGGLSGYLGSAMSASAASLPAGPIIVLTAFALFLFSALCSPSRGAIAAMLRKRRFVRDVHRRQGLLALARDERIYDQLTLKILSRAGYVRADGVITTTGRVGAADALRNEARWQQARRLNLKQLDPEQSTGLADITTLLTVDQLREIDHVLYQHGLS